MLPIRLTAFAVLLLLPSLASAADENPLANLYRDHPRLFIHREDVARIRELIKTDALAKQWHEKLVADAVRMLDQKPIVHRLIGPRLLDQSRLALRRISTLAALYQIDGDKRFADRAIQEMLTAAAFEDWNPSHFLDVAEMTNAMGIGYDWLYDYMTAEQRNTIRAGLVKLGLNAGLDGFQKGAWWTKATHNWSNVCNGGLTVGALAIADEEPKLAADLFARCAIAIRPSMQAYAPDGGFAEGPGYWHYATEYTAFYLGALESALNTDLGVSKMPGFPETGFYRLQCVSPTRKTFNYADAGEGAGSAPEMFYLARIFKQPAFARQELDLAGRNPGIFDLIWYAQLPGNLKSEISNLKSPLPLDACFTGVNVAFFRSAWNDPNALWVGIKGGDNKANHSHLDLGSFVLDALGQRWAVDLGGDDYNLPAYFGNKRWTYYRLRTESHNTITLDGDNQDPRAAAGAQSFRSTPNFSYFITDLTPAWKAKATSVRRGLAMINRSQVLVQDEISAKQPVEILWNFLTPAKIDIAGKSATLTIGQEKLGLTILSPADAKFEVVSANPPPPQKQQPNIHNLTVRLPEKSVSARIAILIQPGGPKPATAAIKALDEWDQLAK